MSGRKPLTDEQRERNNIKRREQRLKNKLEKANGQLEELEASKPPEPELVENVEDPDEVQKRKMEILEKRRKALELARSRKINPSQIRKNNEEELARVKIVKKYVSSPIPIPMKKKKSPRPQEVAGAVPSTDYLVQQTYAEQLQKRMRETMLNRVMSDTFGN